MQNTVLSKQNLEFLTVASEFVKFCEKPAADSRESFISTASKLLSLLYLKALLLEKPSIASETDDEYNFEFVTPARYESVKEQAVLRLADSDIYVPLRDAAMLNSEDYINISLSELWADVYQDIANFTEAFRIGEKGLMHEAVVRCCDNFAAYWGIRLLTLLEHFHQLSFIGSKS